MRNSEDRHKNHPENSCKISEAHDITLESIHTRPKERTGEACLDHDWEAEESEWRPHDIQNTIRARSISP